MGRAVKDPDNSTSVCPFRIVVDTREQAPYHFLGLTDEKNRPMVVPLVTDVALVTGDYTICGMEERIAIERKSVSDFRGSVTAERDRFQREMERLSQMQFAAVVIEGGWDELMQPGHSGQVSPKVYGRTIASWSIRYGVHFFPMLNRYHAELWTYRLLATFWKQSQEATN